VSLNPILLSVIRLNDPLISPHLHKILPCCCKRRQKSYEYGSDSEDEEEEDLVFDLVEQQKGTGGKTATTPSKGE